METQLVQKERLFEDKIKVGQPYIVQATENISANVFIYKCSNSLSVLPFQISVVHLQPCQLFIYF